MSMRATRSPTLNTKQARFVQEYLVDLNATRAAREAGYSPRSAARIGSGLLATPHVMVEVQRLQAGQLDRAEVKAEDVLRQLKRIAFFDVAAIYEWRDVPYLIDTLEKWRESGAHRYKCGCTILVQTEESLAKGCGIHGPSTAIVLPLTGTVKERSMKHPADWPEAARTALCSMDTVVRNLTSGDGFVDTVLKVKLESKLTALELLARHLGLLTEKVEVDATVTMTWLPPEPPPAVETIDADDPMGPPRRLESWRPGGDDPQETMGFQGATPAPSHRSSVPSFSESAGEPSSSIPMVDELEKLSGISRKRQERMFPELAEGPLKRR